MADKFNKIASHFTSYWQDLGSEIPEINFDTKAIERFAEENQKNSDDTADSKPKANEPKQPKEKDLGIIEQLSNLDDTIEKAISNKVKTIIGRIIDDKLRSSLSQNLTMFEKEISEKINSKVGSLKPKILEDLKTIAPAVESVKSDKKPENFTDSAFSDDKKDDILDKEASIEVFPDIFVKASSETKGDVFIKQASKLVKMNYSVDLPVTESKEDYLKQLKANIESLVK